MSEELVNKIHRVTPLAIHGFFKDYRWLSNFHVCDIEWEGLKYMSTEAAFQASKIKDPKAREMLKVKGKFFTEMTPSESKAAGREVPLRTGWDEMKDDIMFKINMIKYTSHSDLKDKLLETRDKDLIEDNWWHDTYWGTHFGKGENRLGLILMAIRARLQFLKDLEEDALVSPSEEKLAFIKKEREKLMTF